MIHEGESKGRVNHRSYAGRETGGKASEETDIWEGGLLNMILASTFAELLSLIIDLAHGGLLYCATKIRHNG